MRFLTKTRFALALECPTKLRYVDNTAYANSNLTNSLLIALADGGHQVGALAKTLFPGGTEIDGTDLEAQLVATKQLLFKDGAYFEAAFSYERLFARTDILVRAGDALDLYEVKAKSVDPKECKFTTAKGKIGSEFKDKLYDVAFQRHVLRKVFPTLTIRSHLILVNKRATASEDRVAQRLHVNREQRRVRVDIDPSLLNGVSAKELLHVVAVDALLDRLELEPMALGSYAFGFEEGINALQASLDNEIPPRIGSHCKRCQFTTNFDSALLDGRQQCLREALQVPKGEKIPRTVVELHGSRDIDTLIADGKVLLSSLEQADIGHKPDSTISSSERQWLQVLEARGEIQRPQILKDSLTRTLADLAYPLHLIDFETARPPIPFSAGKRPYELLLFQFSHHTLSSDGKLEHKSQHLQEEATPGISFESLRRLKEALASDRGAVVHWWNYERNVLEELKRQIQAAPSGSIVDANDLLAFLDDLLGTKDMPGRLFDLGRTFEGLVFLPGTQGRSSIKVALPAALQFSGDSVNRFSEPIYGSASDVPSLNFAKHQWLTRNDTGEVRDPYELLGERIDDTDFAGLERLEFSEEAVRTGGAAMVAFSLLQTGISEAQRRAIRNQLFRYCELDTLAMYLALKAVEDEMSRKH